MSKRQARLPANTDKRISIVAYLSPEALTLLERIRWFGFENGPVPPRPGTVLSRSAAINDAIYGYARILGMVPFSDDNPMGVVPPPQEETAALNDALADLPPVEPPND